MQLTKIFRMKSTGLIYHADSSGRLKVIEGWITQDGKKYYVGEDGEFQERLAGDIPETATIWIRKPGK